MTGVLMDENKAMDRYLSRLDVWAIAFGCMVGWGAFVMPGTMFLPAAGPAGTVIALTIGTLLMLVVGMNFSFLMARNPGTGGVYSYAKSAFAFTNSTPTSASAAADSATSPR